MGKFDHVLIASDFDNTLVYTQGALDAGLDTPPTALVKALYDTELPKAMVGMKKATLMA